MQPPSKRPRLAVEEEPCQAPRGLEACRTPGTAKDGDTAVVEGADTARRIQSVERVFCSQTLASPSNACGGAVWHCAKSAEEDFKISYSQTYHRQDAHRACSPSKEKPFAADICRVPGTAGHGGEAGPLQRQQVHPILHSLTPELACEEELLGRSGSGAACQASRKLFPIFRPVSQWKTLHIIRHGESEYNAATNAGTDFRDPQIFNPKLTAKGQRQARQLRQQLEKMGRLDGALWVSSPLTRAIETMLLSCPKAHLMRCATSAAADGQQLKVAIRHELTEHLVTTGDIGLPATLLRREFPQLLEALAEVPERWWFAAHTNDCLTREFGKTEPKRALQERVGDFRKWVQAQQEQIIVAYGHSSMLKELSGGKRLRNCEVLTLHI